MLSDERINQLAAESGLPLGVRDMHDTAVALLARAIEREATAEAVRIMREWVDAVDIVRGRGNLAPFHNDAFEVAQRLSSAEQAIRDFVERMK